MGKTIQKRPDTPGKADEIRVLITAEEVYPEMERAFLEARTEIWGGFRVFDLCTRLRSEAARKIGDTWFDLVADTLRRGVRIHMALSDFDPILAPDLHRTTWLSIRQFVAAAEWSGASENLNIVAAAHPSRVGRPLRTAFWPWIWRRLRDVADELNALSGPQRARRLEHSPGLRPHLTTSQDGRLCPKRWPPAKLLPATHHQKIAVIDRETLFIGGLDLDERRYDDRHHRRSRDETWHDVQLMVRDDPVVEEAQRHLETFLEVASGTCASPRTDRLLLTLSRKRRVSVPFIGPRPLRRDILAAHRRQIASAKQLIYLETQFFRDPSLAQALAEAGQERPDLQLIMVLPGAPEDVAFDQARSMDARYGEYLQSKAIAQVKKSFGDRALFCSPVRPETLSGGGRDTLAGSPIIYVHAKVSIFDDTDAIISSANLNGRSLHWDTEAGMELTDPPSVRRLRQRVLTHWIGEEKTEELLRSDHIVAALRDLVDRNLDAHPEAREGFLVPHDPVPARRFGQPAPGIPPEMV